MEQNINGTPRSASKAMATATLKLLVSGRNRRSGRSERMTVLLAKAGR